MTMGMSLVHLSNGTSPKTLTMRNQVMATCLPTQHHEEIFFYHSDHLGSTSYVTDAKANITQFDAYLPYGELLVDEYSSTEEMPYKFNGKNSMRKRDCTTTARDI